MLKKISKVIFFIAAAAFLIVIPSASSICFDGEYTPEVKYQVDEKHPPFEYYSDNKLHGFGLDLGRMIFSAGNYEVQYSSDTWSNVFERIKKNEIDVCGLLAVTNERKKEMLFTKPVVKTYRAIYAKKGITIEKISDVTAYRVGVQKSDYSETVLQRELGMNGYYAFKDLEEGIQALKEGRLDIVFGNQEVTNYLLVKHQLISEITPQIINLYPVDLAFGISKDRPELVYFMNDQIDKLQRSGLYDQVFQKHFYRHSDYYNASRQKMYIYFGLFIAFLIASGVITANIVIKQLRKMVDRSTSNLKEEHELLRTTLLSITDGVIAVDEQGRITFMNHVAEKLTGFCEKDSINKPLEEILNIWDTDSGTRFDIPVKEVLDKGYSVSFKNLNVLVSEEGSQHLILGSVSPTRNDSGNIIGALVAFQDISDKKQAEETIKYHEYFDSLTDLPNRKLFNEYLNNALENACRNKTKLSVLIIDLDYFKSINDTLGHAIGDKLLQQAAKRLVKILDDNDVLARMGGDEFTILIPQIEGAEQACKLANKALDEMGTVFNIENHELYITASIGIAVYPDDGQDPGVLMKHADTALSNAKENGRNTYQNYVVTDDEKIIERFSLNKDLRMSIERNEMILHYQPKIDSTTGTIIGMEALLRWNHPERGIISPGVFIPLAEENGMIKQLDNWVLKTACTQFKLLTEEYKKPLRLSVNLSAYQFRNRNLVGTIEQALKDTSFNPSQLELEITETTAMENVDFTIRTLNSLNDMGVNISIDDFGTGYSSLNYLRYFPIHILKIDRSFISDMENDQNTKVIVKSIIDVAHSLKLKVTAEGVETKEQLSILKEMNCDEMQGFLISKPLPMQEVHQNLMPDMI